jgi:hypothetical protein
MVAPGPTPGPFSPATGRALLLKAPRRVKGAPGAGRQQQRQRQRQQQPGARLPGAVGAEHQVPAGAGAPAGVVQAVRLGHLVQHGALPRSQARRQDELHAAVGGGRCCAAGRGRGGRRLCRCAMLCSLLRSGGSRLLGGWVAWQWGAPGGA